MELAENTRASAMPDINQISVSDLFDCLKLGWQDYKSAPLLGLFFSAFYVLGGYIIFSALFVSGGIWWALPLTAGFPLLAPFAAVGLYETSRLLERGEPLSWRRVLGATFAERKRQIPWVGAIIVIWFLFYMLISHVIFAVTMGLSALTNISSSLDLLFTPQGMVMLAAEIVVGAIFAFVLFSITLISLPVLLDKELDFVTAILLSIRSVAENFGVLLIWAFMISSLMMLAMLPLLLGLLCVLPVLGHATWHLYRKLLSHPA